MAKGPKLKPIKVTERQRKIMEQIVRARCSDAGLVLRIKIVLGGADLMSNSAVVRQHGVRHEAVRRWRTRWQAKQERLRTVDACSTRAHRRRTRWQAKQERLHEIESNEAVVDEAERMKDLEAAIREVLRDKHRTGTPPKFSAEQVAKIIAVACEDPQTCGRPISHWTAREIADEAMKRKIVETISAQSVERFLK